MTVSIHSEKSIAQQLEDVRRVTLALVADLSDEQLELPYLAKIGRASCRERV